jgi:hypothetical protein
MLRLPVLGRRVGRTKYSAQLAILEVFTVQELLSMSKAGVFALVGGSTADKRLSDWLRDVFLKRLDLTFSLGSKSRVVRKR